MILDELIEESLKYTLDPNLCKSKYLSIKGLENFIENVDTINEDILILPFFIYEDNSIYELLYAEISIEVIEAQDIDVISFSNEAKLSTEFKEKFNRKITVNKNNKKYVKNYLKDYLYNLKTFDLVKEFELSERGILYFQIY